MDHVPVKGFSAVNQPRGVQHRQPERCQLGVGVRNELLHQLLIGEQSALREAAFRALGHHLDRALRHPDRAHRVMQPTARQPGLQDQEALAGLTEQCVRGHPYPVVVHQGMTRFMRVRSDQMMVGFDFQAGGARRN